MAAEFRDSDTAATRRQDATTASEVRDEECSCYHAKAMKNLKFMPILFCLPVDLE